MDPADPHAAPFTASAAFRSREGRPAHDMTRRASLAAGTVCALVLGLALYAIVRYGWAGAVPGLLSLLASAVAFVLAVAGPWWTAGTDAVRAFFAHTAPELLFVQVPDFFRVDLPAFFLHGLPGATIGLGRALRGYLTLATFPIGAAIVVVLVAYVVRRGLDALQSSDEQGVQMRPIVPVDLSDPRARYEPTGARTEDGSGSAGSSGGPGGVFDGTIDPSRIVRELTDPSFRNLGAGASRSSARSGPEVQVAGLPEERYPASRTGDPPTYRYTAARTDEARAAAADPTGVRASSPSAPSGTASSDVITIWTVRGRTTVPNDIPPPPISPPPRKSRFPIQMLETFVIVAAILVLTRQYWLSLYDGLVRLAAMAVYYPYAVPSHLVFPLGGHTLPDYILLMYLSLMISYGLASGLYWNPKFSRSQRWVAYGILAAYLVLESVIDAVGFTVTDKFVASGFLVLRGVVGGFFTFVLLFDSFVLPQPMRIVPRFPRQRSTISLFIGLAVTSLLLALGVLYLLWNYLVGLGVTLPFAVLLLLPLIALTIFNLLGRIFYERELRQRPVPSLDEYHPPVTVIIPAYNEEARIAQAIRSADRAARLYPGFTEVVVGNDGSTDRTSEVARAEIAKMQHATGIVVDLPHGGKSNALNGVLRLARGEVLIRVDADCRLSEDFGFHHIVPHFADPEVGAVQGMILPLQREGWVRKMRLQEICWNHMFLRRGLMATRSTQVVDGAFSSFRRKDMLEVGGWVPWNGEDNEITLRLYRLGYRTRFEPKALVFEDVPENYQALRKQRVRWNRGGLFAHRRHLGALTSPAFEFGGIATVIWALTFLKSGMRYLIYVYAVLVTLIAGIPTLITIAFVVAFLLIPRGGAIVYYLVRLGYWREILWVPTWPVTSAIKQAFAMEAFGTMTPGNAIEFSE